MPLKGDFYDILGVSRDAGDGDIKKAYRKLAKQYHPDANQEDEQAEAKFKLLTEAYEILSDPEKRRIYDAYGIDGLKQRGIDFDMGGFGAFGDIFSAFFGGDIFGGGGGGPRSYRGSDIAIDLGIDFEEAAFGTKKKVSYEAMVGCETCDGTGAQPGTHPTGCPQCGGSGMVSHSRRTMFGNMMSTAPCVNCGGEGRVIEHPCKECAGEGRLLQDVEVDVEVPGGINDGNTMRLTGKGHAAPKGGQPGDLYLNVNVRPHETLKRSGDDVVVDVFVDMLQAALGDELSIETLDGEAKLKVKPGTQPGEVYSLKGKGMKRLSGRGRGDQHVRVNVVIPAGLSAEQKRLLKEAVALSKKKTKRSDD